MKGTDLPVELWHKSSYSNGGGNCIEVALLADGVATRDSKNPAGPALTFEANAWAAFVTAVSGGEFDRPSL